MKYTERETRLMEYFMRFKIDPLLTVLTIAGKLLINQDRRGITIDNDDFEMLITIKTKENKDAK